MDDEEEDMSRPISQRWGTPFRDAKHDDTAAPTTPDRRHHHPASTAAAASHGQNNNGVPCGALDQPWRRYHGFRPHFPARFEPMEDRGEGRSPGLEDEDEEEGREDEEEHGVAARPGGAGEQGAASVEARIGRKLREIGDEFDRDHVHMFLRHQQEQLPVWMRLTMALYGFLFRREAAAVPRLRGEER